MRIRTRLLLLVFAVLVPAIVMAALAISYVYSEAQHSFKASMRETARAMALVVDKELAKRESILSTLAMSPDLAEGNLDKFYKQAQAVTATWDATINLLDPSGKQILDSRRALDEKKLPYMGFLSELRKQSSPDQTIISNLYLGPTTKTPTFAIQIPVKHGDHIAYYISIGSLAMQLQSVFAEQSLPPGWVGTIVDRNGIVVARSKDAENLVGHPATAPMLKMLKNNEGFSESRSLTGERVFAFFSRAPNSGWTFIVGVPQSEIQHVTIEAITWVSAVSIVLLSLAILGAIGFARRTAAPIEALRYSAALLGQGKPIVEAKSNITEIDAANAAMRQASIEIAHARSELEQQVREAVAAAETSQRALLQSQKLEALGRLTGGIAHDFNNVLQTLTSGLQLIHFSTKEKSIKTVVETCERAIGRATELTRQFMAFGRVQDARLETVEVSAQIAAAIPMLKGGLRNDIEVQTGIDTDLWPVTLDPLQFELALLNLAINAQDAMPHGGVLRIEARNETVSIPAGELTPGDYVCVSVIDTGHGMSQDVASKAIEPFFTTKSIGKGSGMGLPQAYGFAKQTGGALVLQSKPGEGTAVMLYMQRAAQQAMQPEMEENAALMPATPGGRLLFVEDDAQVREVMQPVLKAAGFDVAIAKDGDEAMAMLEAGQQFDLVFSDIVMPGKLSGIDLANIIRQRFPHIRVVLATGYSDRRVSIPNVRIIAKPYDVAKIVEVLSEQTQLALRH